MVDVWGQSNPLQGVFESSNVGCPHVDNSVGVPADSARLNDFRDSGEDPLEVFGGDGAAAVELDVGFDGEPVDRWVDLDGEASDDAVSDELVHAPFYCRCGKPDGVPNVAKWCSGVVSKVTDDANINLIHAR